MEEPGPLEQFKCTLANGTKIQGIRYNAGPFLRDCVAKYKLLHAQEAGFEPTLRHVDTPFLAEDQKPFPAGMPCATGPCVR